MHDCWHDEYGRGSVRRSIGQVSQSFQRKEGVGPSVCGTVCMVTDWDVSQVKNMGHMFSHARAFNQPLAGLDVSQVEDMNSMFEEAIVYRVPRALYQPIGPCTCICTCCCLHIHHRHHHHHHHHHHRQQQWQWQCQPIILTHLVVVRIV